MRGNRKRWWTRLVTVAAVLTVLAATLSVSFRFALDAVPGYRSELERYVEKSVGHPVRIGSMALSWHFLQPALELRDVALLTPDSAAVLLEARRLSLGISLMRLLGGHLTPSRVEAAGIELDVDVDAEGHWSLRGVDTAAAESGDHRALLEDLARFDSVSLLESRLLLHDARLSDGNGPVPLSFQLHSASVRRDGGRYTIAALLDLPEAIARRASLSAAISGDPAEPASWHGNWQIEVQQLAGWPWLAGALTPGVELALTQGSFRASGKLDAGSPGSAVLDLQIGSLVAREGERTRAQLADLAMHARIAAGAGGSWRIDLDRFALAGARGAWNAGKAFATRSADTEGGAWQFEAAQLRLDDLAPWLSLLRAIPASAARLPDLRGDAESVRFAMKPAAVDDAAHAPSFEFSARLHGVGLASSAELAGFAGLDAQLEGNSESGRLLLGGSPLKLQMPDTFEHEVAIESLRGELQWQRTGDSWRFSAPALTLRVAGSEAEGDAALQLPADPAATPVLNLHLSLRSADATTLKPLMPKSWGPNTRAWLTRALTKARVTRGELKIDAPITARTADGRMTMPWRLDLAVADAEMAFSPDWPPVTGASAQLHFHDGGLDIMADDGELEGNRISAASASIADFHGADLVIDGSLAGDGADFYRLLRNSPLTARLGSLLALTEARGPTSADVHLRVPLDSPNPSVQASGAVHLDGTELAVRGLDQPLREVRGRLAFDATGVTADALSARLYNTAITARIRPEAASPDGVLIGEFAFVPAAAGSLEEALLPAWLRAPLSGSAQVQLRLPFSGPDSGRLSLASDLRGVASLLPPPLAKLPGDSMPLDLVLLGGGKGTPLRLQIEAGDTLGAGLRFAETDGTQRLRGVELRLGPGETPRAEAEGFVATGSPAVFELASWVALLGTMQASEGTLPFTRADLHPQRLLYHGYSLGPTHLLALPSADHGFHIDLEGAALGQIDWHQDQGGRVVARLQSASFEALPPLPSGPVEAPAKYSPFDPGTAPLLDLDCTRLSLGDVDLGHLTVNTARVADGQRIERLQLADGKLVVDAHGSWLRRSGATEPGSSADLAFEIHSAAIADVLRVFGYAANLSAADTHFSGHLNWARVPAGLELAQAGGTVKLDVKRGTLRAIEPGAGRVLGLLNLYALPRRLLFDFRDVVSKGLAFDTIHGSFRLADGNARTDDLLISGPQSKVRLVGRIGLAARDYDERVTVTPDISTGVTLGATLLGGPIGGGIALVAQQLFGKPFNLLARFSYRVTGSWDNPEVLKGTEEPAPPPKHESTGENNG